MAKEETMFVGAQILWMYRCLHRDFPSARGMLYNHCTNKGSNHYIINPIIKNIQAKKDRKVEIKLEFGGERNQRSTRFCALCTTRTPFGSVINSDPPRERQTDMEQCSPSETNRTK
ncbi:hypothetical protein D1007_57757 [Hordeum vulgare]|nr:hypothetical protein D1007_57757 [Hordeum vulgare]